MRNPELAKRATRRAARKRKKSRLRDVPVLIHAENLTDREVLTTLAHLHAEAKARNLSDPMTDCLKQAYRAAECCYVATAPRSYAAIARVVQACASAGIDIREHTSALAFMYLAAIALHDLFQADWDEFSFTADDAWCAATGVGTVIPPGTLAHARRVEHMIEIGPNLRAVIEQALPGLAFFGMLAFVAFMAWGASRDK